MEEVKIRQTTTADQTEAVVLAYLKGMRRLDIKQLTSVSFWHINRIIYNLEAVTADNSMLSDLKEKIIRNETRLFELARLIAINRATLRNKKEYTILLYGYASADLNGHRVYLP